MSGTAKFWPAMIGVKFNKLVALEPVKVGSQTYLKCICDCGNLTNQSPSAVRRGRIKSCGCGMAERNRRRATHGHAPRNKRSPEYRAWLGMKARCDPTNEHARRYYAERGIVICDSWMTSFENFLADMGSKPTPAHTLDRYPDNDGNYEPSNCRWATRYQQIHNRRPREQWTSQKLKK